MFTQIAGWEIVEQLIITHGTGLASAHKIIGNNSGIKFLFLRMLSVL